MATQNNGSETEAQPMDSDSPGGFDIELKLHELIGKGLLVFDDWVSLISRIETTFPDNIEKICLVYDSFLSEFPLCHGYWRRYADHKIRLCTVDEVVEVFDRAVQSATYSVGVWVDYCFFSMSAFEDPSDIRRLFKRGMSYVGKDYSCHALWDKYIQFELSQQKWSLLAHIYIEALRFPTKKLHHYYDSFKKLAALCDKELGYKSNCFVDSTSDPLQDDEVPKSCRADEISCVIKDLFEPSLSLNKSKMLLQKYLSIGERLYQEACQLDEKISAFEMNIRRSYFHVKPLDTDQLENWHNYLDFVEKQGDFDWVVKLYERCLIPCAHYPEFWMRYADFMETKGGREIANHALDRATQVFLKRVPVILLFNARFREHEGDVTAARSTLHQCDDVESDLNFVDNIIIKANMEKRLGNFVAASNIFEEALATAMEKKKLHTLPNLYVHFSRLKYMIDGADAAKDVLIDGIKRLPNCKLLLEELINFATSNGGQQHIPVLDSVIHKAISPGLDMSQCLNVKDAEDVSSLYLKFIDLCGTIHEVRKAWNRHIRLFPCSLRTAFHEQKTTNIKSLELAKEGKEDTIVNKHQQPSQDCNPACLVKLPLEDKKMSRLENYDSGSDQDSTNHILEQKVTAGEKDDIQFEQAHTNQSQSGEADSDMQERVELPSIEVSKRLMKDTRETNVCSVSREASEQPREDTTKCEVAKGTESEQALKEHSSRNDLKQECDHEPEQDTKTLSLDSLSLHARESTSIDLHPSMSPTREAPTQETCNFDGTMLESNQQNNVEGFLTCSQRQTNSSDSPPTEIKVVDISSSRSHQSPISTEPPHQRIPANSSGNCYQINNSAKFHRSRGHLQRRSYQHQQQVSPQQHFQAEPDGSMLTNQGYPSQVVSPNNPQIQQGNRAQHEYQATCASVTPPPPGTWPSQYMQQPNYAAPSQALQSSGDHGMQNSQAYNQMWQHYYHQQQLFQQQQQPQLQQQHSHLSQPYQQQQIQLQQQYYSHPQQQQPYQQLQWQQQQYNPQQEQQYPPQQQLYQQPLQQQQQFYQQPQQQHQLYMQQVEPQPQPPPLPSPQQQTEQEQHQQQYSQSQVQELNYNYYQQNASLARNGTSQSGPEPASHFTASQDQEIQPSDAREP